MVEKLLCSCCDDEVCGQNVCGEEWGMVCFVCFFWSVSCWCCYIDGWSGVDV